MKLAEKIISRIIADKGIKAKTEEDAKDFLLNAKRYIKAIKESRMCCIIHSVSKSGMSRTMSFHECQKGKGTNKHWYLQFWKLFDEMGYRKARNHCDGFSIQGCGMDMVFATNYDNIHNFKSLGIINKKQCAELCQMTPAVL